MPSSSPSSAWPPKPMLWPQPSRFPSTRNLSSNSGSRERETSYPKYDATTLYRPPRSQPHRPSPPRPRGNLLTSLPTRPQHQWHTSSPQRRPRPPTIQTSVRRGHDRRPHVARHHLAATHALAIRAHSALPRRL